MNWYIAKVVFNIVTGTGDHKAQFDEQYRLIKADTLEEALYKAEQVGFNEEELLINIKQEIVRWDFVGVTELYPFNDLRDGMELFSAINEEEDRGSYLEVVKMKTAYVRGKLEAVKENA
ncbi:hypothetical protein MASR2M41_27180 [Flammeovirgaceae bacterium]